MFIIYDALDYACDNWFFVLPGLAAVSYIGAHIAAWMA